MFITRDNYEEFFMLYADNELTAAQKEAVETFAAGNIDLQEELELFKQFKLQPDEALIFSNKDSLLKQETAPLLITETNYDTVFVLYADNELNGHEKAAVEDFVARNPALQPAFTLLMQAKLDADNSIVFTNKESLYRKEKDDKVIPFWWRLAAAAALILFVSGVFLLTTTRNHPLNLAQTHQPMQPPAKQAVPQTIKDTVASQDKTNKQTAGETIAATIKIKDNPRVKKPVAEQAVAAAEKKEKRHNSSNIRLGNNVIITEPGTKEQVALTDVHTKSTSIGAVDSKPINAEINRTVVAAAKTPVTDQQVIILTPDEDNKNKAEFASFNNNVEVLNTSVDTKNSLRGFLRKASRLIAKKTSGNDDGNHKNILIGGFEIAVR